ncbi:MAG TPA: aminotransferase class I/II-fold pyridoxal phosphate-dependent enzyme [Holophagaceae bacterium]|nr:aminotransferase class I/II-fold pyridoxal phosphate-dependent enzyme [Holophagaceae bacterium]
MATALSSPVSSPAVSTGLYADRVALLDTENAFKVGPMIQEVEAAGHHVVRCNIGEPDFPLPRHIAEEVKRQIDADLTHYNDPQGILPLREAIAHAMGARRGLKLTADRVVVFPGAKPPIGLAQQTYCNPGDEVIYPSPGFPIYESFTGYLGAKAVPLHLDEQAGFSFTGRQLESLITERTKLIYINFPSNPTGGVASREQIEEIAAVILRKTPPTVRVYSDEVYEDILFDGARHHSIASVPGMEERTILVSGVSKSYSWTGGRVGWAVFPTAEEAAVFKNLNINYFSCIPAYNQMGAKVALESPESAVEIARMNAAFQKRRDLVVAGLNAIPGITCQLPKGAFYVFPNIGGVCERLGILDAYAKFPAELRARTTPSTLFQRFLLFHHHVATLDRKSFGRLGTDGLHFLRLSIATAYEELELALVRIRRASEDRDGFRAFLRDTNRLT